MTKAQRLFKKWNYLSNRPHFNNHVQDKADRIEFEKVDEEFSRYLTILALQGKLFSINTNGHLCNVNTENANSQKDIIRIDDIIFLEDVTVKTIAKETLKDILEGEKNNGRSN